MCSCNHGWNNASKHSSTEVDEVVHYCIPSLGNRVDRLCCSSAGLNNDDVLVFSCTKVESCSYSGTKCTAST